MTYINASLLNDIQISDATNEKKFPKLGIVDIVKDSTSFVDFIPPSAREQFATISSLRNIEIPVLKDQTIVVNQTPGFDFIPTNQPESAKVTFTMFDVFSGFRHYPSAFANNMVDSDWMRANVMKNVLFAMGNEIETILAARLEERKTQKLAFTQQVSLTSGDYTFNETPDILEIKLAAQTDIMFRQLDELMDANDLGGAYRLVTSRAGVSIQKSEALKFGSGNEKDLRNKGFIDLDRLYESNNISVGSEKFNGWLIRDGAIGMYANFPFDFVNGTEIAGKKWSISDLELPFTRMRGNIYTNKEATEATALITSGVDSNLKMTHFEEMAIWNRFVVVFPFNSDLSTRPNDIVKIQGLTT